MIFNATITRIDLFAGVSEGGDRSWTSGAAISQRCTIDAPSFSRDITTDTVLKNATAVLYVPLNCTPAPAAECRILVAQDGLAAELLEAVRVTPRVHGSQSHFECFLKRP